MLCLESELDNNENYDGEWESLRRYEDLNTDLGQKIKKFNSYNHTNIVQALDMSRIVLKSSGDISIKLPEIAYNISESIKKSGVGMNGIEDSFSYLEKKYMQQLEKYIEISKQNGCVLSIDDNKKVKASEVLREILKQVLNDDIETGYSKNTVIVTLGLAAKIMDMVMKKDELQKLINSLLKDTSNPNNEDFSKDKTITIKEAELDQFAENNIRLYYISKLKDNWNENGASHFSKKIINTMKNLIKELPYQPEIFPTACRSIQFEYEKEDGSYLEFELFEDNKIKIFTLSKDDEEKTEIEDLDFLKVAKVVSEFYE